MQNERTLVFKTVKSKTIATLVAVIAAVALPQLVHAVGSVSGMGTSLGEALLPMHLAVILIGFLAGPICGVIAGACAPLLSFAISGMPTAIMLPFILIELVGYGFVSGMLSKTKLSVLLKLLIVQLGGRALRSLAVTIAVFGLSSPVAISSIWMSLLIGLPGILLQWALIPLLMYRIEKSSNSLKG